MMNDPGLDLWALDEVHFQQHGSRCRMWIPAEERDPVVRHEPTRKSVGYFGAVRLRDGKFVFTRERQRFNAQTFWDFMKRLRHAGAHSGRTVAAISDNARYHHAVLHEPWRDACLDRFRLHFLPPYSPDLNPVERVWKLTRRLATHNRYFSCLEEIVEAVETQFVRWSNGNDELRRLCNIT